MATHRRSRRFRVALATATVAAAFSATTAAGSLAGTGTPAEGKVYGLGAKDAVRGSYIVLLTDSAQSLSAKAALVKEYGGTLKRSYSSINAFSVHGLSLSEARKLASDPNVDKVVTNKTVHLAATQDKPPSWGLDRVDQAGAKADGKYTYPDSAGEGVTAYVIDTGARITHKDFGGRASYGHDFIDDDDTAQDGHGHGTHVAGTVAGTAYGVAKKAKIVAVRVCGDDGSGTTEGIVAGVDWVTRNHKGPSVVNMSLATEPDEAFDAAVQKSIEAGITYAVAAGNEWQPVVNSPARVPEALTVAASMDGDANAAPAARLLPARGGRDA